MRHKAESGRKDTHQRKETWGDTREGESRFKRKEGEVAEPIFI